ncbi:MAG: hypothetical protein ACYTHM_02565 [Planctomycetota bacterium]|jgi:predicted esterase
MRRLTLHFWRFPSLFLASFAIFTVSGSTELAAQGKDRSRTGYWEPRPSEWAKLKKILPYYLWLADPAARKRSKVDASWKKQKYGKVKLSRKQFAELSGILREGSPFTTEKARQKTLELPTGKRLKNGRAELMPVTVLAPSAYRPGSGKSFPLIVTCHGGPIEDLAKAKEAANTQFVTWKGFVDTLPCIVAAPVLTGSKFGEREWTLLKNLIDEVDGLYNVDRNRILLTGHSWGGILTWHIGPPHADTFCVLAPFICAVNPGKEHLRNCRAIPIYHVQGANDIPWIVNSGRERKKILDELKYEHVYKEKRGGHDVFPGEVAKIAKYFIEHPRNLYAKALVRTDTRVARNASDTWYWIKSRKHAFTAVIDGKTNAIDVDINGPFEVFLADGMVNLDKPVIIKRKGRVVRQGKVERRLAFTLEHVKTSKDRGRVFAASVKVP